MRDEVLVESPSLGEVAGSGMDVFFEDGLESNSNAEGTAVVRHDSDNR